MCLREGGEDSKNNPNNPENQGTTLQFNDIVESYLL